MEKSEKRTLNYDCTPSQMAKQVGIKRWQAKAMIEYAKYYLQPYTLYNPYVDDYGNSTMQKVTSGGNSIPFLYNTKNSTLDKELRSE